MRKLADSICSSASESVKEHSNVGFKISCLVILCAIIGIIGFIEFKGITINGTHIMAHNIKNYKSIVESSLKPVTFTTNNDELTKDFTYVLTDDYKFNITDIGKNIELDYSYNFDENALRAALSQLNDSAIKSENAYIDIDTETIVPEIYGTAIDIDKVLSSMDGKSILDLSDFYVQPNIVSADLQDDLDLLNEYRNWTVTYINSDISINVPKDAVSISENGDVTVNDTLFLNDYVSKISDEFNTVGITRNFETTNGDIVQISGGTFGNIVDTDKELEALVNLFEQHKSVKDRTPEYSVYKGEVGDTYVEVSIADQHVWVYENGNMILDSDCVTGNISTKHNTPTGIYYMDIVEKDRMLWPKGATSGSHVDRWMRFTSDGCGLHDASWRSKFGGSIYKTSGSHGCVNCPKQFAYDLFEHAYVGMPVIVY